jgi:hypothetical protein
VAAAADGGTPLGRRPGPREDGPGPEKQHHVSTTRRKVEEKCVKIVLGDRERGRSH